MSGFGERFRRAGYDLPKPLIPVLGKPILAHVTDMFPGDNEVLFICNREHLDNPAYALEQTLRKYCPEGRILDIAPHNKGPVYAVSCVFDQLSASEPTIVCYCDFSCIWDWETFKTYAQETACDGAVMCYTGFHPHMLNSVNYAYVKNEGDRVLSIQEKRPYTDNPMREYASAGMYYFASGALMREAFAETMRRDDLILNGEYYVSLAYVPLLERGKDIRVFPVERFMQWGTPEDLEEFLFHARIHTRIKAMEQAAPLPGTLLMPMAGQGCRFADAGYTEPKALIPVDGLPMFLRAKSDLPAMEHAVFVTRADLPDLDRLRRLLEEDCPNAALKVLPGPTDGQAVTCLAALDLIDPEQPLTIGACDNGHLWNRDVFAALWADRDVDFIVWVQRAYPAGKRRPEMYGWADADERGRLRSVSVKKPLENPTADPVVTGTFTFRRAGDFRRAVERMLARGGRINSEFYVDECCNDALALGLTGVIFAVDAYVCWGTPDELRTYEYWRDVFTTWPVASDHRVNATSPPPPRQNVSAIPLGSEGERPFIDRLKTQLIIRKLKKYITNDIIFADIGCGYNASVLNIFNNVVKECIGLDIKINHKLKFNNKFTYFEGDIHETIKQIPDNYVDFVTCLSILEHLENSHLVLSEIYRILKYGGRLFFSSPTWFGKRILENIVCKFPLFDPHGVIKRQADTHKMYFAVHNIWPVLVKSGFIPSNINLWYSNIFCSISGCIKK
ncbi:MAG: NTP transferase domain-containing protein [Desulfovibrio sp.]|nr:NTP transferase domain-containing protein [Desulfovibrio sp.]